MRKTIKSIFVGDSLEPLAFQFSGVVRYIPLITCGGFFLLTILIFAFGPLEWNVNNPLKLYIFLFFCCLSLTAGYAFAINNGRVPSMKLNFNTNRILLVCSAVYLIMYVPTLLVTTGKWYPDIVTGIFQTGKAYRLAKHISEQGPLIILYFRMLLSPFMMMVMPITLFFMPKLTRFGKTIGTLVIIASVCMSISQGINKMVADTSAQLVLFLIMLFFANKNAKDKAIQRLKIMSLINLIIALFFAYYSTSMRNRVALDKLNYTNEELLQEDPDISISENEIDQLIEQNSSFGFSKEKKDYILFKIVPKRLQPTALYLASYLSHGYMGLSIAMNQEFTSTYGLGFSDFFRHNLLKIVGQSDCEEMILSRSYLEKTNRAAWKTGDFWSTFFIYPASDITFPGTVALVFIIGFLFGLSWKDALVTENPFAIVTFFGFCTMIFYFSANNQMFQGGENFIGFTTMIIVWLYARHYLFSKQTSLDRLSS